MAARVIPEPPLSPRISEGWRELFRYADGAWLRADGTPDVAFGGLSQHGWPFAVAHSSAASRQVMNEAMSFVSGRYSCSNGRRVNANGKYV